MSVHNTSPAMMWTAVQPPFTVAQWQELEHQALIFKYLKAGLTVPPDLLVPIRNSLQLMMSHSQQHHLHHPSLGYYGKKIDPEPGRCRRTDGKKWRCARDAHTDSKYCERHMIRRRCRSRKPVESQSQSQSQSQSSSTSTISHLVAATTGATTAVSAAGTGTFQNLPLHTNGTRQGFTLGNGNITMMEPLPLPTEAGKKEYRFGLNSQADEHNFFQKDLGTVKHLSYDFLSDGPLTHMAQIPPNTVSESRSGSTMVGNCFQPQTMRHADMLNLDYARSKELVFNGQLSSPGCLKQEYQSPQPLLSDWPWKKDLSSSAIEYKPNIDFNWNPDVN